MLHAVEVFVGFWLIYLTLLGVSRASQTVLGYFNLFYFSMIQLNNASQLNRQVVFK